MKQIQLLENSMINKIAAGEVVERPVSIVKELTENSIDAKATSITIEVKEGGIDYIRVTDNGKGIQKEEVRSAFLRHATSKIKTQEDLEGVLTLGFRGEALSSISSIAQVELITKTNTALAGIRIELKGDEVISEEEIGCATGTSIIVRNVFFNVPARRKFLKKNSVEFGYISDLVFKLALGHPDVAFKFINNGSLVLQTNGNNDLKTAIFQVYGKEIAKKLIYVNNEVENFKIEGYIAKPELSRSNRKFENTFINGRYIKSEIIESSVESAFKTKLPIGRFPIFILNLTMNPRDIDANVHPTKLEVRFRDEDFVYDIINNSIKNSLNNEMLIPIETWKAEPKTFSEVNNSLPYESFKATSFFQENISNEKNNFDLVLKNQTDMENLDLVFEEKKEAYIVEENFDFKKKDSEFQKINGNSNLVFDSKYKDRKHQNNKFSKELELKELYLNTQEKTVENSNFQKQNEESEKIKRDLDFQNQKTSEVDYANFVNIEVKNNIFYNYKIVGQLFNTYWIIEQENSMYLIDQHAAHERILYEKLINDLKKEKIDSQILLQPKSLNVSPSEKQIILDNIDLFEKFGFEIEELGETNYVLRSVPYIFKNPEKTDFFMEILDKLGDKKTSIKDIYESKLNNIASISCKAAVKGNDKLSHEEAKELIDEIMKIENPFTCPHGRPTIIEMSRYELEKKFKRIQ